MKGVGLCFENKRLDFLALQEISCHGGKREREAFEVSPY